MGEQQNPQPQNQYTQAGQQTQPITIEKKPAKPIVGYIALVVAIIGLLGCIPGALIVGWVALPIAFILAIVGLFQRNLSKKPAIAALILSVLGLVISPIVFVSSVGNAVDDAFNQDTTASNPDGSKTDSSDTGAAGSTRENPLPIGTTIESDQWAVTIDSVNLNANDEVMNANTFNDPAPEGFSYGLVHVTAKYKGNDPQGQSAWVGINYVTADGKTMDNTELMAVGPENFDSLTQVYENGEIAGNVVILVPVDGADQGVLAVTPDMMSKKSFVAVS
ncbi:MAG: hypothetical protein Q4E11_08885 [Corynebacterium sp.]|uniref:hypothetical protein n=1 Tax=Corynebacterium sp. TaxID=1720 RepID=UPI0026DCC60D|nr:hypothetical protein [Corynebacterium sp.]MDO5030681.1 hypothetical protein [Corynebacterium sp.]